MDTDRSSSIGERVAALRAARRWPVTRLAGEAGLTEATIYRIESNDRHPRSDTLAAIATALGVTTDELLGLEPPDDDAPLGGRPVGDFVLVPLVGHVTAGHGGIAEEHIEQYRHIPATFIPDGGEGCTFLVQAHGESMVDAGIEEGDLLLVCSGVHVNDGDVAVLDIEGEAVVKRVYHQRSRLLLVSDNPEVPPRQVSTARLVGRVMKSIRDM